MNAIEFRKELEALINRNSMENGSSTPDFILADYLVASLAAFDAAVTRRAQWYGHVGLSNAAPPDGSMPAAPDNATLAEFVCVALGESSMCWDPRPTGVFDSTRAYAIAERLCAALRARSAPAPLLEGAEPEQGAFGQRNVVKHQPKRSQSMSEHILEKADGTWYWVHIEETDGGGVIRSEGSAKTRGAAKTELEEFKIAQAATARKVRALAAKAKRLADADAEKKCGTYAARRKAREDLEARQEADWAAVYGAALAKHRKALGLPAPQPND